MELGCFGALDIGVLARVGEEMGQVWGVVTVLMDVPCGARDMFYEGRWVVRPPGGCAVLEHNFMMEAGELKRMVKAEEVGSKLALKAEEVGSKLMVVEATLAEAGEEADGKRTVKAEEADGKRAVKAEEAGSKRGEEVVAEAAGSKRAKVAE